MEKGLSLMPYCVKERDGDCPPLGDKRGRRCISFPKLEGVRAMKKVLGLYKKHLDSK